MPFHEHESFESPSNEDIKIWRFMDLAKYLSLLKERALWFSNLRYVGDDFEGAFARPNVEADAELLKSIYPDISIETEARLREIQENRRHTRELTSAFHEVIYVNCWHMNEFESAAMWVLYALAGQGIAVQSTYRRFSEALIEPGEGEQVDVMAGIVRYVDYNTFFIPEQNAIHAVTYKRKSFEHEREFRTVCVYYPHEEDGRLYKSAGIGVKVDLDILIERVYVSPKSPGWFRDVVESVTSAYGLIGKEVITSSLDERPLR